MDADLHNFQVLAHSFFKAVCTTNISRTAVDKVYATRTIGSSNGSRSEGLSDRLDRSKNVR